MKTQYLIGGAIGALVIGTMVIWNMPSEMSILREAMAQNDHRLEKYTKEYNDLQEERQYHIEEAEKKAVEMTRIQQEAKLVREHQVAMQTKINALIKGETLPVEGKE